MPLPDLPVHVVNPVVPAIPLVCDSPHSGTHYPADFDYSVGLADLRKSEDTHVDWLWDGVPEVGGTLVHATFPRSYLDVNRHEGDIDLAMLTDGWPEEVTPTARSLALGNGLVSSLTTSRQPIYARRLAASEVAHRIEHYWRPYRRILAQALTTAAPQGPRWHLNLHSMPSNAYERLGRVAPGPLADVVLGNLNGVSCSAEFTELIGEAFRQRGYTVSVNDPYAGQDLLRVFGDPVRGHESLQIELNRAIYLNEQTRELLPRATQVREDIGAVLNDLARHIREALQTVA
jgi:N-formylglutamate deformylase